MSALNEQVAGTHYLNMPIQPVEYIYKNGLGHVRAYTPQGVGAWLGMYDPVKKAIDASVPEPEE